MLGFSVLLVISFVIIPDKTENPESSIVSWVFRTSQVKYPSIDITSSLFFIDALSKVVII
jgi:hypothetical protein